MGLLQHFLQWLVVVLTRVTMLLGLLESGIMTLDAHALLRPIAASTAHLVLLRLYGLIANLPSFDLQLALLGHWGQEVLGNVALPVRKHPVSLNLLVAQIHIFYVHPRVVCVVAECYFQELLGKKVLRAPSMRCIRGLFDHILQGLVPTHVDCRLIRNDVVAGVI